MFKKGIEYVSVPTGMPCLRVEVAVLKVCFACVHRSVTVRITPSCAL